MDLKLWNWNWNQESYPASSDFLLLYFFALFFPFLRLFLDRFIFQRTARRLISPKGYSLDSDKRRKKIAKFKECAWKCLCSISTEAFAFSVTYQEPWFKDTRYFWLGPGNQFWPDQMIKLKMKGMYMFIGGLNVYSFFALLLWETRRSDFNVMLLHHISTSLLIIFSYIFRFARVGSVILILHDISDVFLEIAKMSKYSGAETMGSFFFILFFFSWTVLRLVYYPFWVLWSTSYELLGIKDEQKEKFLMETKGLKISYYFCNTLLFSLLILHIYWWILICRVLINQIRDKGIIKKDIRSDSESEDEHQD